MNQHVLSEFTADGPSQLPNPVFQPNSASVTQSQLTSFMRYSEAETWRHFGDYAAFEDFAKEEFCTFWRLFLSWSKLTYEGDIEPVCAGDSCENATFFPNLRLNYAELLLAANGDANRPAITACHGDGRREQLTRLELNDRVLRLAVALRDLGVRKGDRVAVIARNNIEAVVAALATAAIGAVYSSCAPDMGAFAILSRFTPLQPVVLIGNIREESWDAGIPVASRFFEVAAGLPSISTIIALDDGPIPDGITVPVKRYVDLTSGDVVPSEWERFPFNHPLFIMFSSGTTGVPKCIIHGAGGTLLEHLKEHRLHCDLKAGDKLFFQTSCAWMMWNWQLSALASGTEILVYDGPIRSAETIWRIVSEERVTVFGTNPAYLQFCEAANYAPGKVLDLRELRSMLSTGSILFDRQYDWVDANVKSLPLQSISGGTDMIGCFVLGNPNLPVYRGEAQCRSLGLDVRSLPPPEEPSARVGELVCANPFPSRPLGLYGDSDGSRLHNTYFSQNPGVWTHGDLIELMPSGGARIHGRSDGVLNIRGVRVGPAEIYTILQSIGDVVEAMAVEQQAEDEPGGARLILLVVLRSGVTLDDALSASIRSELANRGSAALVPARIVQVDELPMTHNGKRSEAAAREAVNGRTPRNLDALKNPHCIQAISQKLAAWSAARANKSAEPRLEAIQSREQLEQELQRIWENVFEYPIGRSEDFHKGGAKSLKLLSLFIKIEERFNCKLPSDALFIAPTVNSLATLLWENRTTVQDTSSNTPRIRPAGPDDVDAICLFLQQGFKGDHLPPDAWRQIFNYNWLEGKPNLGYVLTAENDIVGFLGAVYARRKINGKSVLMCNLTSWYVLRKYRGWGASLLTTATRDAGICYTAFTPASRSIAMLKAAHFSTLDEHQCFFPPFAHIHTLRESRPTIIFDPDTIRRMLSDEHRRIFDDHLPYGCLHMILRDKTEAQYAYLVFVRRRLNAQLSITTKLPYSQLLYCSAPSMLARHLERVKLAVLKRHRSLAIAADERLFTHPRPGLHVNGRGQTLYRSPNLEPAELDKLYSELVLLPV